MLDLDLINNSTLDIKINGEVVGVKEPTYSLVIKTKKFFNGLDKSNDPVKSQNDILLEFLNNNVDSKKFTERDIMAMSSKGVTALSKLLIDTITGVEANPN
ncbi:hypothetical protein [Clostridium chrysemydis]|uniref:hypothetical protein n=1 Tax=Clostridium chrysemydis TaxID=2665504 RepID=UPI0018839085|nr:hypothetical protein [Clostridium chrysemydis]